MPETKTKRGPGRPRTPGPERKAFTYIHSQEVADYLEELGEGNRSAGLRLAVQIHRMKRK